MINFSFAITVCNEANELKRLLTQLKKCVVADDEVVIQVDQNNTTEEVLKVVSDFEGVYSSSNSRSKKITTHVTKLFIELKGDFSDFKNNLKKNCTKDWIFFIDADEEVNEDQINLIRQVVELNSTWDCYLVPRINTVAGLTQEHIGKWGWRVDEKQRINFPDYQYRICQNKVEIRWVGAVHERLEGYSSMALLPAEDVYALGHHKTIQKQEKQNEFYTTL
jgi:glycosyltransferase involved in cell wall biosynthesis